MTRLKYMFPPPQAAHLPLHYGAPRPCGGPLGRGKAVVATGAPHPPTMYSTGREGGTVTAVPSNARLPRTAIVADSDAGRLALNAHALRGAGYTVLEAADAGALARLLEEFEPSVIIADAPLSAVRTTAPVLVMVDLDDPADIAAADPSGVHDCITKPPAPQELVHRTSVLIEQVSRRRASRQEAEALREQLREVSAAVRATNDPQEIANHVVSGFGRTFKADHVVLA